MSWDEYIEDLDDITIAAGIVSTEGAICGYRGDWKASPQEALSWAKLFQDLSLCRQRGLVYGGTKLFVTNYSDKLIVARRDNFIVQLVKSQALFIVTVCDKKRPPKPALQICHELIEDLAESGY